MYLKPHHAGQLSCCWSQAMPVDHPHAHTVEEERRIREAALDETLANTFPASDPPSTLPNPDDDEALPPAEP
jgi:hypothetical protein